MHNNNATHLPQLKLYTVSAFADLKNKQQRIEVYVKIVKQFYAFVECFCFVFALLSARECCWHLDIRYATTNFTTVNKYI